MQGDFYFLVETKTANFPNVFLYIVSCIRVVDAATLVQDSYLVFVELQLKSVLRFLLSPLLPSKVF